MCGIAGIIDLSDNPIDSNIVKSMSNAMARRGPDADGLLSMPNAVLGHRRLSILDLTNNANQPMSDKNNDYSIVFNGEIYNHKELRKTLQNKGFEYFSDSDTETILYGYQTWGEKISSYLRGMWAFAIWDKKKSTLFLSRDRFGEKPFYYFQHGSRLIFASSLNGLVPALQSKKISSKAVSSLLSYEYIPNEECIYHQVKKIAPASNVIFNSNGLIMRKYWNIDYKSRLKISSKEAINHIDELLVEIINEQLISDVPTGVFLSGGVDSGYISAIASKLKPGIKAITMTVPDSKLRDESINARRIVSRHDIESIEVPMNKDCIKDLPQLMESMEPFGDSSLIPTAAVSKAAQDHLKVVLTGDGGDEIFGGYGAPLIASMGDSMSKHVLYGPVLRMLSPLLKILSKQRTNSFLRKFRLHSSGQVLFAGGGITSFLQAKDAMPHQVSKLIYGEKLSDFHDRVIGEHLINHLEPKNYDNSWQAMFNLGIRTRLVDDFLYKVDSASMHYSIETRAPFLDHRLIEFTSQLPREVIIPDNVYKFLLKKISSKYNPAEVVYSSKKGFSIPVEEYFINGWGNLLFKLIKDGVASQMGFINPHGVKKYIKKHGLRANSRIDRQLFTILIFEIWLRVFHEKIQDAAELGDELLYYSHRK